MITNQSQTPVATSGVQSEAFFNVKQENLPWIFGILRNNLYSDKPLAILREYSANAVDAHVEAGTPNRPFAVTMPTALYPSLVIRDFGKGLSEEDVYNVFASYGASTKRDTNQQIGGFGLGSKSAFSYVNSFTIVSFFGGKKSVYEAFIDETNIGKVVKVSEEATDEESGIEITVTVKTSDIPAFVNTAKNLFKHFTPKPIIKNNAEVARFLDEYISAKPVLNGKTWTLSKQASSHRSVEVYCVMGNIRYPIQLDKLKGDAYAWVSSLYSMELVLRTPIGSVKMSASREALEYDEATINFLNETIQEAMQEATDQISDKLKACKTLWEARILLREIQGKVGNLSISPIWNGRKVDTTMITSQVLNALVDEDRLLMRDYHSRSAKMKWTKVQVISPKADTVIYVDKGDVGRNSVFARITQDMGANSRDGDVFLARFANAQQAQDFITHPEIVGATIVDLASINYVPPKRGARGTADGVKSKQMYSAFVYNGSKYAAVKSQAWDAKDIDVKDGEGVYVRIHGFVPDGNNLYGVNTIHTLHDALAHLATLTGTETEIVGFRTKVDGLGDGWVTLHEKIKTVLQAEFADPTFQAIVMSQWVKNEVEDFFTAGVEFIKSVDANGKMGKLLNRIATMRVRSADDNARLTAAYKLALIVGMTEEMDALCEKAKAEFQRMEKEAIKAYPMLRTVRGSYGWSSYKNEILGYVALVDKQ